MNSGTLLASPAHQTAIQGRTDITQHEIAALRTQFNLADAHTHQAQSPTQQCIVERLPSIWEAAVQHTQQQSEQAFIRAFYHLHGQDRALEREGQIYLVYAASIGMHITATYLQQQGMRVGLIEPCFDNLHDLMRHMQIPMVPLGEELFADSGAIYQGLQQKADQFDAVFLVDPNNPTGTSLVAPSDTPFREVVRFCVDHDKLLVLDFCFAAFILASGHKRPDVYAILEDSGVRYIAMEDTGKTWPLQDAKCATISTSLGQVNDQLYPIVTSVLLNVSPFILRLVTEYVRDSGMDGFASVRTLLDENRHTAQQLHGGLLNYLPPAIKTSVAWFEINDPDVSADALQAHLLDYNVYVLSGKYFYWSNPERGQRYIRLALARNQPMFAAAIATMGQALEELAV
ncbi:threonine-phosphate decarboxylase [Bordetella ansorpii]|uniref:Threonine-phosphate decarboxylase n=1 Tax=Bordetella ansorpii TaxID=288768 RepID=A0A157SRS4_9BORD|nr:aminotransferase class I/II-fold pyridoxal phosphate-dependent enzyme [Bordetella ansorpii]SAI73095.1 threonine-phosphate decarboxylase [Bordetella ansorpii]